MGRASLHVAVATDERYLPWAATMMRSCLVQHAEAVHFHVLHDGGIGGSAAERLRRMVEGAGAELDLTTVEASKLAALPSVGRFGGRVVWLRFFLPELLPELDRVVYLDADTLAVAPLTPLWETPLGDAPLAAVANVVEPAKQGHVEALGLGAPGAYFNSGVLLLNLAQLRREEVVTALVEAVEHQPPTRWPDQDALNRAFAGRWLRLHPRWNAQWSLWVWPRLAVAAHGAEAVAEATATPSILHFEGPGPNKPWHYLSEHPWRERYLALLNETPWRNTPPEDRTVGTRLIRRLPRRARVSSYAVLLRARAKAARLKR